MVTVTAFVIALATIATHVWPRGAATLYAAVQFEVRLAEEQTAPGLVRTPIAGTDRVLELVNGLGIEKVILAFVTPLILAAHVQDMAVGGTIREGALMPDLIESMRPLFEPQHVAVIGASRTAGKLGRTVSYACHGGREHRGSAACQSHSHVTSS